jgi:hypothetical protein
MADNKKTSNEENTGKEQGRNKPDRDANPQPMPDEYSNEANFKGAVDLGTDGTKATASQQQGQGSWNAKDHDKRGGKEDNNSNAKK